MYGEVDIVKYCSTLIILTFDHDKYCYYKLVEAVWV